MDVIRKALAEASADPSKMEGPDDLPKDIKKALPDGAEKMFYKALMKAKGDNPDEQEGQWYAMAWDKVNDKYKKDDDGEWVKNESITEKIDRLIQG